MFDHHAVLSLQRMHSKFTTHSFVTGTIYCAQLSTYAQTYGAETNTGLLNVLPKLHRAHTHVCIWFHKSGIALDFTTAIYIYNYISGIIASEYGKK